MASLLDICNEALTLLGCPVISDIDDGQSEQARVCKVNYPIARDYVLRSHAWNCARRQTELSRLAAGPLSGFKYAYSLPTDPYCLRVLKVYSLPPAGERHQYRLMGRTLECNLERTAIDYVARLEDPGLFDPLLAGAIAAYLAAGISLRLTGRQSLEHMMQLYSLRLNQAMGADDAEEYTPQNDPESWIEAREQQTTNRWDWGF